MSKQEGDSGTGTFNSLTDREEPENQKNVLVKPDQVKNMEDETVTLAPLEDNSEQLIKSDNSSHHNEKPVPMPAKGKTLKFPRVDNVFTHKESLGYDEA